MIIQPKYRYLLQPILLTATIILLLGCKPKKKELSVDIELNLAGNHQGPMGASVFKYLAQKAFLNHSLFTNIKSFEKWQNQLLLSDSFTNKLVYIIAAPEVIASQEEVEAMADFVEIGNSLVVIADFFNKEFLHQFLIETNRSFKNESDQNKMRITQKYLTDSSLFTNQNFRYYFYPFLNELIADSSLQAQHAGLNDAGQPDFLRIKFGKGQLLVLTNAASFCNYFLLTGNNYQYALALLSYLPAYSNGIYWDDFYRRHPNRTIEKSSILNTILTLPGFRWAFALLLTAGIFWMATEIWRRQRIIPVQNFYRNTTLEFNQTIAHLYLNNHDNQNIATKMIAHFKEFLQTRYFISNIELNNELANILTAKTGLNNAKMKLLIFQLRRVQEGEAPMDATLLWINKEIQTITHAGQDLNKKK